MTWFDTARFGMFVHWSHCSRRGIELSWPLVGGIPGLPFCSDVPVAEYHETASTFDPQHWDAGGLADTARRLGMQYAVITTKHHEGFCLWDSDLTDYKATKTPYGKDLLKPIVEELRARQKKG